VFHSFNFLRKFFSETKPEIHLSQIMPTDFEPFRFPHSEHRTSDSVCQVPQRFNPKCITHYPTGYGVYIYGLLTNLKTETGEKLFFLPVYVGEGDLFDRVFSAHYLTKFALPLKRLRQSHFVKGGNKELWHFPKGMSLDDACERYTQMGKFSKKPRNLPKWQYVAEELSHLIYYQDYRFFQRKMKITPRTKKNFNLLGAFEKLNSTTAKRLSDAQDLQRRILQTLDHFESHFFFVYAEEKSRSTDDTKRKNLEKEVKTYLANKGLFTTASAPGKHKKGNDLSDDVENLLEGVKHLFPAFPQKSEGDHPSI